MQGSAGHDATGRSPTLAGRDLPRRVKKLLKGVLDYVSDGIGPGIVATLERYEQTLVLHADKAQSGAVRNNFHAALREVRRGRDDVLPAFRAEIESALASLRDPQKATGGSHGKNFSMALVEDVEMEESIILGEIANRTEIRNTLPLFLLGQRFGVIAGKPGFEPETLPIGPHQLGESLRIASQCLDLNSEHRHLLFKQFDREVLQSIGSFYETVNQYLISEKVLPNLTYVPIRARPTVQNPAAAGARSGAADPAPTPEQLGLETVAHEPPRGPVPAPEKTASSSKAALAEIAERMAAMPPPPQPSTRWPGQTDGETEVEAERHDGELFSVLRELMAGRRSLVGKLGGRATSTNARSEQIAKADDIQRALSRLQAQPPQGRHDEAATTSVARLKQDLLAQLRQLSGDDSASALAQPDDDAIDLIGLLFDHLGRELRPSNPAAPLLSRLQVPLLRVALGDKGFFSRRQHPARQMLSSIAEAGEFLNPQDEADRGMLERMQGVVERASREYNGDPALFESLVGELNQHLQTQSRKAELAERRHVEASRGREKLEIARLRAAESLDALLAGRRVPRFLRTLLAQAWSDVLALSLLRGGEQSDAFKQQFAIAERLLEAAEVQAKTGTSPIDAEESDQLRGVIEAALVQVGHHVDDVAAISQRLLSPDEPDDDDPASSTELAMRLKRKVRFGQDADTAASASESDLTPAEIEQREAIIKLPFGTWFEFSVNQQGLTERRRLSWFSTVTGHCLFLNHRGQRTAECSIDWLAREVARGNVRIVMQPPGSLVDRAWGGIVRALHSFAGRGEKATP